MTKKEVYEFKCTFESEKPFEPQYAVRRAGELASVIQANIKRSSYGLSVKSFSFTLKEEEPEKFNICSTQELVVYLLSKGDKGATFAQMFEETIICAKEWTKKEEAEMISRFDRYIAQGGFKKVGDSLFLTDKHLEKFTKPMPLKADIKYIKTICINAIINELRNNPQVSQSVLDHQIKHDVLPEYIRDRIDDIYDVCLEQTDKREEINEERD